MSETTNYKGSMSINYNEQLSAHFKRGEFFDPSKYTDVKNSATGRKYTEAEAEAALGGKVIVDETLLKLLESLRAALRKAYPGATINITPHGGYRPTELNKAVGGANGSQHRYGRAVDFRVKYGGKKVPAAELAVFTERHMADNGFKGGVGMYDADDDYIHVDVRGKNVAWYDSYSSAGCPGQGGRPCVYKKGTKGAGVVLIQQELNKRGYNCGTPDGKYGSKTAAAVAKLQSDNGIRNDGIYGSATNKIMGVLPW